MWAAYRTVGDRTPLILGTMLDQHADGPDPNGATSLTLVKKNSGQVVEAVRDALTSVTAVRKGQIVGYVDDGLGGRTPLVTTTDLTVIGVPGQRVDLRITPDGKELPRSAKAGTKVGGVSVGSGPDAARAPLTPRHDLKAPPLVSKLTRLG